MDLYFFDPHLFRKLNEEGERRSWLERAEALQLPNGRPFFINCSGDIDRELDEFVRQLIAPVRVSRHTWESYARQLHIYFRFLASKQINWKDASQEHINAYFSVRTRGTETLAPIKAASWNVAVSAIRLLYEYAFKKQLISSVPFAYREFKSPYTGDTRQAADLTAKAIKRPPKYIDIRLYLSDWRLSLSLASQRQRNLALADLLITTGLRLQEALSLTVADLPDPNSPRYTHLDSVTITVIGKGRKERTARIPKRLIRELRFYIADERAQIIETRRSKGKPELDCLFVTNQGALSPRRAEEIFASISTLTGIPLSPHGCRHTFAIYQLNAMIKRMAANLRTLKESGREAYAQLMNDPLRVLQKLLGHSRLETTFIYLDFLEETEALVDEAMADWTEWDGRGLT